jgi:hypothetical protein
MDGSDLLMSIMSNPILLTISLVIVAAILCILSLILTLYLIRRHLQLVTSIAPQASAKQEPAPPPRPEKPVELETSRKPVYHEVKVAGGVETLEEVSLALSAQSILLFNLAGMPIEAYNVRDEDKIAAILADVLANIRRVGLPTDTVISMDGVKGNIFLVTEVGGMEVYAYVVGDINIQEAQTLLKSYISSMTGRVGGYRVGGYGHSI